MGWALVQYVWCPHTKGYLDKETGMWGDSHVKTGVSCFQPKNCRKPGARPGTDLLWCLQRERGPATALILNVYPPRLQDKLLLFKSGLSSCQNLVPDGLKRSWGNNRNKVHNNCNALESSPNHPPVCVCTHAHTHTHTHTHTFRSLEKLSSTKPVLGAKIRVCWFKPLRLWSLVSRQPQKTNQTLHLASITSLENPSQQSRSISLKIQVFHFFLQANLSVLAKSSPFP